MLTSLRELIDNGTAELVLHAREASQINLNYNLSLFVDVIQLQTRTIGTLVVIKTLK